MNITPTPLGRAGDKRSLSILLVDDNIAALEMMAGAIRQMGHRVETVSTGEDAIRQVAAYRPDVVLMDIRMPGIDGYEAARRIKTLAPEVVVLAISGYVSMAEAQRAEDVGCAAQLAKPLEPALLEQILERLYIPLRDD